MNVLIDAAQRCLGYIQTIQISDLVDIAVLSYVIYRLLLWVRNSNVGQVLKGIILIFVMLWATNVLHLNILNYLLGRVVELGFLAIIVVFQPEIRHFLEQIGAKGIPTVFSRENSVDESETAIDELVDAYASMSKDKIGALTVFERGSILDDSIKSGTSLDSAVSSELLKNIFWPKAPLHDGAVIIRGGRIIGAGCVLPLSSNTSISRELGTRHRAGIGMTEYTDAVVVICSEETGSISVAVGGMLKRHLAPETLRRMLRNELLPNELETDGEKRSKWSGLLSRMNSFSLKSLFASGDESPEKKEEADHVE